MHPNDTDLNDYADESLDPRERAAIERHLGSCAACRQLVEDLRDIAHAAGALDPREPPVRGWSRLERAIKMEREHVEPVARRLQSSGRGPAEAGHYRRYLAWLAVAAALVLATAAGLWLKPFGQRNVAPAAQTGAAAAIAGREAARSVEAELRQAEEHYLKAITGLEQITSAEQGALDPQTVATLRKSLAVIDQAIGESRAAVRSEPTSEPAQQSLIENFKAKMGLLQDTVALINEMRRGNEAGTARIVSGLKQKGD
jgi:anti-sigma-K factor RskA